MLKNPLVKNFVVFAVVFVLIAALFGLYNSGQKPEKINIKNLIDYVNQDQVKTIDIDGSTITAVLKNDQKKITSKEGNESFLQVLNNYQIPSTTISRLEINVKAKSNDSWFSTVLPLILPFLLIGGLVYFMFRQVQGSNNRAMSFGQSNAKTFIPGNKNRTTFADIAGCQEAKEELQEVVEFLKSPDKFLKLGAKIPKGVLLFGGPGTGKTLLARAVAGEAKVPFFHISGSEFVEMFVGVGASRVRDLFAKAKKVSPCIIFIDEIDAVGRQRGSGLGGSHDEREQTLNQILVEIDGFEKNDKVIVIAATNRPDVLDPALLRPGRFDRQVIIDLPDIKDRLAILKVHAKNKPLEEKTELEAVAQRTPGFSGADLANVLNEAAILAARNNRQLIQQNDLLESIEKTLLGPIRKSYIMSDFEKKITAYHEAGHALISHILPDADPVHKVSIISRGRAAGYTMNLPITEKKFHNLSEFLADIQVMLAGYAAEKMIFNELTTGASNDLVRVTKLARSIISEYGMSEELGPRTFGAKEEMVFLGKEIHERRDYSEKTAEKIDQEIDRLVRTGLAGAQKIITENRDKLDKIANELLVKETLEKEQFEELLK